MENNAAKISHIRVSVISAAPQRGILRFLKWMRSSMSITGFPTMATTAAISTYATMSLKYHNSSNDIIVTAVTIMYFGVVFMRIPISVWQSESASR